MEYGAHIIPEGGWKDMPQLYTDGVLVAGDAASMVNALHWEGTNMAIVAGKAAAETAIEAHQKKDFSAKSLSSYRTRLDKRFIMNRPAPVPQPVALPEDASRIHGMFTRPSSTMRWVCSSPGLANPRNSFTRIF